MWSTIANLKENLNKMALDVHHHDYDYDYDYDYHDDDEQQEEELGIYDSPNRNGHLVSDHRFSHNFAYSLQPSHSNRFEDSPDNFEVEQYKVEIKRLHESEAEIKALSVNYAALLKEKEDRISRLNEENSLLKQNLNATNAALNSSRNESFKTSTNSMNGLKGSSDQSPNWQHKALVKFHSIGDQTHNGIVYKQDGLSNGIAQSMQPEIIHISH